MRLHLESQPWSNVKSVVFWYLDESDKAVEKSVSYYSPKQNKTRRLQKALCCWTHLFTSTNGEEPLRYPLFMDVISCVLDICNFTGLAKCFGLLLILRTFVFTVIFKKFLPANPSILKWNSIYLMPNVCLYSVLRNKNARFLCLTCYPKLDVMIQYTWKEKVLVWVALSVSQCL